jgi:hypothetical protein
MCTGGRPVVVDGRLPRLSEIAQSLRPCSADLDLTQYIIDGRLSLMAYRLSSVGIVEQYHIRVQCLLRMHFQPNPEESYRIQSADFETYLEVSDVESGSRVIMRPRKNNDKQMVNPMC